MKVNGLDGWVGGGVKGFTLPRQTSSLLIGRSPALACQPRPPTPTSTPPLSAADGADLLNSSQTLPALCFPPCFFFSIRLLCLEMPLPTSLLQQKEERKDKEIMTEKKASAFPTCPTESTSTPRPGDFNRSSSSFSFFSLSFCA